LHTQSTNWDYRQSASRIASSPHTGDDTAARITRAVPVLYRRNDSAENPAEMNGRRIQREFRDLAD
jgi:hypothetical protein